MDRCLYHMIESKPQHNREQLENLRVYNSVTRKVPPKQGRCASQLFTWSLFHVSRSINPRIRSD